MQTTLEKAEKICSRCVMDSTDAGLRLDAEGVCQYCRIHEKLAETFPLNAEGEKKLRELAAAIKKSGRGKNYDVIVGVSGGRDSTYGLYVAVKLGLRPLAVHFDNGWNSEIAVTNIKRATSKLNIDLHTYVVDWDEFKDLQLSFLKASVSDAEIPTDVGIHGILHRVAAEEGIKYILFAHSFRTEGFAPLNWTYMDGRYVESVHRQFGTKPLKTFPNLSLKDYLFYRFVKGIKVVPLLAYVEYDQKKVEKLLEQELGWTYYGGHHHESYYTHFFQSYYLPQKFKIDKRKIENSALVRSGQMTREQALAEIQKEEYPYDPELVEYTLNKIGLNKDQFQKIMASPNKSFKDYPTYYSLLKMFKLPIRIACAAGVFPKHLYLRYFG